MDKNPPANAGDTGSIPGLGILHIFQGATKPSDVTAAEAGVPRVCALQQQKPAHHN